MIKRILTRKGNKVSRILLALANGFSLITTHWSQESTTAVHLLRLEYAEKIGEEALKALKEGKVKLDYMGVKFVVRRLDLP